MRDGMLTDVPVPARPHLVPARQRIGWEAISFRIVMGGLAGLALVLLLAPTLVVLIVSFTSGLSLRFPPPGLSLRWYVALGDAWQLQFAAWNSLKVAAATTARRVSRAEASRRDPLT